MKEITFKDLSIPIKIAFVFAWIELIITSVVILTAVI
jgi:hypothetical protein